MNKDSGVFVLTACKVLDIKHPVHIALKTKPARRTKNFAGYCETRERKKKIIGHYIYLNLETCLTAEFPVIDVIAHELVHACMIENGVFDPKHHHNKRFQNICQVLEKHMNAMSFKLGKLYHKDTDTD